MPSNNEHPPPNISKYQIGFFHLYKSTKAAARPPANPTPTPPALCNAAAAVLEDAAAADADELASGLVVAVVAAVTAPAGSDVSEPVGVADPEDAGFEVADSEVAGVEAAALEVAGAEVAGLEVVELQIASLGTTTGGSAVAHISLANCIVEVMSAASHEAVKQQAMLSRKPPLLQIQWISMLLQPPMVLPDTKSLRHVF